jgi:glycosyltransferase involved in cell wall biosynthesis
MKIVHVVEPLAGGLITFIKSLVETLPEDSHIVIHGERKQVMAFSEVRKQFVYPNVRFIRWKSAQRSLRFKEDISSTIELYNILKRLKDNQLLDVIHLHSSKAGFIGRIVCRMLNIQHLVVYTPNGAPFLGNAGKASNYFYKKLEKLASIFGGKVVCCSPSERKAYELAGVDALMINNGTLNKKKLPSKSKQKKDKVFRIVTSGRIVNQKNPVMFNKIASYFEEFEQFQFLWVGDGTERNLLKAKNIQITGWLEKVELNEIVNHADMYLSTATFEGLPFSVLEALALKKPVLLSECVGNKDLVKQGLNGGVFKNENEAINKIVQFYNNASMLSVMGEYSGIHCATSFDIFDTFKSYRILYQKISYKHKESLGTLKELAYGTR